MIKDLVSNLPFFQIKFQLLCPLHDGRVKGAGSVFGEDVILANVPYPYKATTLTFVDISILDRSDLELILDSFPEANAMLRRRAKRKSLCQRMIRRGGVFHAPHSYVLLSSVARLMFRLWDQEALDCI